MISSSLRQFGGLARRRTKNLGWYARAVRRVEEQDAMEASPPYVEEPLHGRARPLAYFEIRFGTEETTRRVEFELADDLAPRTVENFLALCERDVGKGYRGSLFHQVRPGFGVEGGDFIKGNGTGGQSSFEDGLPFEDETFAGRHTVPGTLSMANHGVDTNSSVFFISTAPAPHLDGRNVLFGKVTTGLDVIETISKSLSVNLKPLVPITIIDCGRIQ